MDSCDITSPDIRRIPQPPRLHLYKLLMLYVLYLWDGQRDKNSASVEWYFIRLWREVMCCSNCNYYLRVVDHSSCGQEGSPVAVCVAADMKKPLTEDIQGHPLCSSCYGKWKEEKKKAQPWEERGEMRVEQLARPPTTRCCKQSLKDAITKGAFVLYFRGILTKHVTALSMRPLRY